MSLKPSQEMNNIGQELLLKEFNNVRKEYGMMDLFGFNFNGDCCEIEVKVADYDFHKEFTKPSKRAKHLGYSVSSSAPKDRGFCPTRFYYFLPENIVDRALDRIKSSHWRKKYGIISFNYNTKKVTIVKKSERLTEKVFTGMLPKRPYTHFEYKQRKVL